MEFPEEEGAGVFFLEFFQGGFDVFYLLAGGFGFLFVAGVALHRFQIFDFLFAFCQNQRLLFLINLFFQSKFFCFVVFFKIKRVQFSQFRENIVAFAFEQPPLKVFFKKVFHFHFAPVNFFQIRKIKLDHRLADNQVLQQAVALHNFVIQIRQGFDLFDVVFVHDQGQPQAEFGDFHRAWINVNAVEGILDAVALEIVDGAGFVFEVCRKGFAGFDDFVHHSHGKRARADGRIANLYRCQLFVNRGGVLPDAFGQFVMMGGSLLALAFNQQFILPGLVAVFYQYLQIVF
ncbi:MAG: hypothetical protein PHT24_07595 [Endomicrobiaceae bacterium]|nr:hypothetical protein [Endomicrobiaceae bacterium]